MKYIVIVALLLSGCSFSEPPKGERKHLESYTIVEIDGCEYIEVEVGARYANNYAYSLTHKGNCKNRIHVNH